MESYCCVLRAAVSVCSWAVPGLSHFLSAQTKRPPRSGRWWQRRLKGACRWAAQTPLRPSLRRSLRLYQLWCWPLQLAAAYIRDILVCTSGMEGARGQSLRGIPQALAGPVRHLLVVHAWLGVRLRAQCNRPRLRLGESAPGWPQGCQTVGSPGTQRACQGRRDGMTDVTGRHRYEGGRRPTPRRPCGTHQVMSGGPVCVSRGMGG